MHKSKVFVTYIHQIEVAQVFKVNQMCQNYLKLKEIAELS